MKAFFDKYKFNLLAALLIIVVVSGTAVTYALWEEKLDTSEDIIQSADVWNESEKYIVFSEIKEGSIVTAYAVADYSGIIDTVEIPRSHLGKPVTTIKSTFINNTLIKEIIIPDTVIIIESNAFLNFTRLDKVTVRGSEKTLMIGEYAFMNCSSLAAFYMDANRLLGIADTAFFNTTGIVKPAVS